MNGSPDSPPLMVPSDTTREPITTLSRDLLPWLQANGQQDSSHLSHGLLSVPECTPLLLENLA